MTFETGPLLFVLAPQIALPATGCSIDDLVDAQQHGPHGGSALGLFSVEGSSNLALGSHPTDGRFNDIQRQKLGIKQLICDAVVPHFEPQLQWMGVYQEVDDTTGLHCLD